MKIIFVNIQNFRKLRLCRIDFSDTTTLFVGANNSGKTSAMDALGKFLADRPFVFNDFTLSHHSSIKAIGSDWEKEESEMPETIDKWEAILPTLDIWLDVADNEIHYVAQIIPTLKWRMGLIGIRFVFQPKDISKMFLEYKESFNAARATEPVGEKPIKTLWPKNLCEFIERKLSTLFTLKTYILDPQKTDAEIPQKTAYELECFTQNPLDGLIQIDMIPAQRGLSDQESSDFFNEKISWSLSGQFRSYYDKHLDPEKKPTPADLETLKAMENAKSIFDKNLADKFALAIKELENLGYPGLNDPKITISSKVSTIEALKHDSAVQYSLNKNNPDEMKLPEKHNGLGYQNLITIVFRLIAFRDNWMQEGKAKKETDVDGKRIAPLHLVLLEEPEAHLHMQVQQVFIRKAYTVLRNHDFLEKHSNFSTQLVVSTHSSHIAREVNFANLRYFKRLPASPECSVATAKVINLSETFGNGVNTDKFVTRYLQTTHCDLFFADAAILVEGSAESMLIPHFIRSKYTELDQRYISILSINGKHSHRLKPLIEKLCLTTLIITDIDSVSSDGHHASVCPARGKGYISGNYAITKWLMSKSSLDELLDIPYDNKAFEYSTPYKYFVRIAYQTPFMVEYKNKPDIEAISRTFEDCLIYANLTLFESKNGDGLIEKIHNFVVDSASFEELHKSIYNKLRTGQSDMKAEFALDLIYSFDPGEIVVPPYIHEGLNWLEEQLKVNVDTV